MLKQLAMGSIRRVASLFGFEVYRTGTHARLSQGIGSLDKLLRTIARAGVQPECILDVGANKTNWSRVAANVFPNARFILIEPQQEMLPNLKAFCAEHPNSRYVLAGAGAQPGELVQTIWDDLEGSSFLPPTDASKAGKQRKTPIVTIDSVLEEEKYIPAVTKLDIQGFELEALKGASKLFGQTECFILEVSLHEYVRGMPSPYQVIEFMHQRGYEVYDICDYSHRPLDGALGQMDIGFGRVQGKLFADRRWASNEAAPG